MVRSVAAALVAALVCGTAAGQQNRLNIFIWSEYIDPDIVKAFAAEHDCKVNLDLYEDNESMIAKLRGGGDSLYDIVVPSDYVVPAMIKSGLLAPLRHENVPNLKNIDPAFANPPSDPGNKYTAPYQWGTVGLYIRKKKDAAVEQTWGLVFDPARQPGSFLMMDDLRACFAAALLYKGCDANSTNPKELREARDLLLDAKRRSRGFEGGVGGKNKVLAKTVDMAMVYNGDAVRGMGEDEETVYFVPKEGGEIWMDSMAVPAKAPNRVMAEKFINYILDAKVGAQLSNFNQYATPNLKSREFIAPADLANTAIYPAAEFMPRLHFLKDLGKDTRLYDELWTQVKSK